MNKKNIYLLYAVSFLQGMVFYAPIATLYRQSRGISVFQITLIESVSMVVCLLLEVPWGFVADRIGYRKTLIFCNLLYVLSKVVFWQAHSFGMFLAERLMLSVIISGLSGCDSAFLYLSAGGEKCACTQKIFGIYTAVGTAGTLIATIIYSLFFNGNYDLTAFSTIFPYGLALFLTMFSTEVENSVENRESFSKQFREFFTALRVDRRFILFLLAAAFLAECNQTVNTFLSQLQYVRGGLSPALMGYPFLLITAAGLAAANAHGLVKRLGEGGASVLLFCVSGFSCLIMAFFANPVLSVLCLVLLCSAAALFVPIQMEIQNRRIKGRNRAAVLSAYAILMDTAAAGTNLAYGWAADAGVSRAMLLGAGFCAAGLLLYYLWRRFEPRTVV